MKRSFRSPIFHSAGPRCGAHPTSWLHPFGPIAKSGPGPANRRPFTRFPPPWFSPFTTGGIFSPDPFSRQRASPSPGASGPENHGPSLGFPRPTSPLERPSFRAPHPARAGSRPGTDGIPLPAKRALGATTVPPFPPFQFESLPPQQSTRGPARAGRGPSESPAYSISPARQT